MKGLIVALVLSVLGVPATRAAGELEPLAALLDAYLAPGEKRGVELILVDYGSLAANDAMLREALAALRVARLDQMSAEESKAFWINAYNTLALEAVVRAWPIQSIKEATPGFFDRVWDEELAAVGGEVRTLGEIEHEILRPMGDPRIHAAIVCASVSCPDLVAEPYRAEDLEARLDEAMRSFLANPAKGLRVDSASGEVRVSKIFDWFREDFETESSGLLDFLVRYAPEAESAWIEAHREDLKLRFLDYDWRLNGPEGR